MASSIEELVEACSRGVDECRGAVRRFLESMCPRKDLCLEPPRGGGRLLERYSWVEEVIRRGVPDGRSRLILYVISRYLVNVKRLPVEEALLVVKEFLDNSCRNHGNCRKIYDSWIRNVLRSVERGGWLPWSLERMKERDPELYDIIKSILEGKTS